MKAVNVDNDLGVEALKEDNEKMADLLKKTINYYFGAGGRDK